MSTSFQPYGLQHAGLLHPPLSPGVSSNSCPLSQWCCLTISSPVPMQVVGDKLTFYKPAMSRKGKKARKSGKKTRRVNKRKRRKRTLFSLCVESWKEKYWGLMGVYILLPWMWGISSQLLQQSAATAAFLGRGVSPHRRPSWPWTCFTVWATREVTYGPCSRSAQAATDRAEAWPIGATPHPRSGAAAGRSYPTPRGQGPQQTGATPCARSGGCAGTGGPRGVSGVQCGNSKML